MCRNQRGTGLVNILENPCFKKKIGSIIVCTGNYMFNFSRSGKILQKRH